MPRGNLWCWGHDFGLDYHIDRPQAAEGREQVRAYRVPANGLLQVSAGGDHGARPALAGDDVQRALKRPGGGQRRLH